jgi:F0F1-type ATP synthase assembly protein I
VRSRSNAVHVLVRLIAGIALGVAVGVVADRTLVAPERKDEHMFDDGSSG